MKTVKSTFDQWAVSDRASNMTAGHAHIYEAYLLDLENHSQDIPSAFSILDVACGYGEILRLASKAGLTSLFGLDLSPEMAKKAQDIVPAASFEVGDFTKAESFALFPKVAGCVCVEAIYYAKNPCLGLQNFKSALDINGRLDLFLDFYQENRPSHVWAKALGLKLQLHSIEEWKQMCLDAGFSAVSHRFAHVTSELVSEHDFLSSPYTESYADYLESRANGTLWLTAKA